MKECWFHLFCIICLYTSLYCLIIFLQPTSAPVPTNPPTTANPTNPNPTIAPTPQPTPNVSFFSSLTYLYTSHAYILCADECHVLYFPSIQCSPTFSAVVLTTLPLKAVPMIKQTKDAAVANAGRMEIGLACANKLPIRTCFVKE